MLSAAAAQQPPTAAGAERIRSTLFSLSKAQLKVLQGPENKQLHSELARYLLVAEGALSAAAAHQAVTLQALMAAAEVAYYSRSVPTQQQDDTAPAVMTLLKERQAFSEQEASHANTFGIPPDVIALATAVVVGTASLALNPEPEDAAWLSARPLIAAVSTTAVFQGMEHKTSSHARSCLPRMLCFSLPELDRTTSKLMTE